MEFKLTETNHEQTYLMFIHCDRLTEMAMEFSYRFIFTGPSYSVRCVLPPN
jgi:hypothetical protein